MKQARSFPRQSRQRCAWAGPAQWACRTPWYASNPKPEIRKLKSEIGTNPVGGRNSDAFERDTLSRCGTRRQTGPTSARPRSIRPRCPHPKPETRNPKPKTRNPVSGLTRNPKSGTRNPEPGTRNPELETRNPKPGFRFSTRCWPRAPPQSYIQTRGPESGSPKP